MQPETLHYSIQIEQGPVTNYYFGRLRISAVVGRTSHCQMGKSAGKKTFHTNSASEVQPRTAARRAVKIRLVKFMSNLILKKLMLKRMSGFGEVIAQIVLVQYFSSTKGS